MNIVHSHGTPSDQRGHGNGASPSTRETTVNFAVCQRSAGGDRGTDEPALDAAMARYAGGDEGAFAPLYRALCPRLFAYLVRLSRSREVAFDLAQETWLRIHRSRSTFAPGGAVLPWAYAIARNVHWDHLRSARLRANELLGDDAVAEPVDRSGADAEGAAILSETMAAVERVLERVPSSQRRAFELLRCEGLCVDDAAAVLGTTASAVKLRAFRAYEALRAELEISSSRRGSAKPEAA
jgi:RNA polymerase sigma-70 factor (ECF subfamily)